MKLAPLVLPVVAAAFAVRSLVITSPAEAAAIPPNAGQKAAIMRAIGAAVEAQEALQRANAEEQQARSSAGDSVSQRLQRWGIANQRRLEAIELFEERTGDVLGRTNAAYRLELDGLREGLVIGGPFDGTPTQWTVTFLDASSQPVSAAEIAIERRLRREYGQYRAPGLARSSQGPSRFPRPAT